MNFDQLPVLLGEKVQVLGDLEVGDGIEPALLNGHLVVGLRCGLLRAEESQLPAKE